MLFSISTANGLAIYRQIVEQIKTAIGNGLLKPGERLPSHREMASMLVIAPLTVKKAYDVLEGEQLIYTDRGVGTFVSRQAPRLLPDVRAKRLRERARALLVEAYFLKASKKEILDVLRDEEKAIQKHRRTDKETKP